MRLTDCSYEYLGDASILGKVEKGGLTSIGDPDGGAKLTFFYWDDGLTDDDGKALPEHQRRNPRMRQYDNMIEAKIIEDDGETWTITGLSNRAEQHGAFSRGDTMVSVRVKEGERCNGCSGR